MLDKRKKRVLAPRCTKRVLVLEAHGAHRKNTGLIHKALQDVGISSRTYVYREGQKGMTEQIAEEADGYISRVNPGIVDASKYLGLLGDLVEAGVEGFPLPSVISSLGSKLTLHRLSLSGASYIKGRVHLYHNKEEVLRGLLASLIKSDRVLKELNNSSGNGVFIIRVHDRAHCSTITPRTIVDWYQAVDGLMRQATLQDFVERHCEAGKQVVDQQFMPSIQEGEYRAIMVGERVEQFFLRRVDYYIRGSTLDKNGMYYTYENKDVVLVEPFVQALVEDIKAKLNFGESPLYWVADWIYEDDRFYLVEINASCPTVYDEDLAASMAQEVLRRLTKSARRSGEQQKIDLTRLQNI